MRTEKDSVRQLVKRRQVNCLHLRELYSTSSELQLLEFRREATTSFAELRGVLCPLFEDARPPRPPPPPPPKPKRRRLRPTPFVATPPTSAEAAAAAAESPQRLPALQRLVPNRDVAGCDCLAEAERRRVMELQADTGEGDTGDAATTMRRTQRSRRVGFGDAWQSRQTLPDFSIRLMKPHQGGPKSNDAWDDRVAGVGLKFSSGLANSVDGFSRDWRRRRQPTGMESRPAWDPHPVTSGLRRARTYLA